MIIGLAFVSRINPNVKALLHTAVCLSYTALYVNAHDTDHLWIAALHATAVAMWLILAWRGRIEKRAQQGRA